MLDPTEMLAATMPLASFRVTDTCSADTARAHVRSRFPWTRIEPNDGTGRFRLVSHHARIGRLSLVASASTPYRAVTADGEDYAFVWHGAGHGTTCARLAGREVAVDGRHGMLVSRQRATVDMTPDAVRLILAVPEDAVRDRLRALLGHDPAALPRFQPTVPLDDGPGTGLIRLLEVLLEELDQQVSIAGAPLVLAAWEDLLLSYLVAQMPHDLADEAQTGERAAAPWQVRQAEAWLEAHASEPVTMDELAAAVGVSLRTLQHAFRRARGYAPSQFLRTCRLELARRKLLAPDEGTTVTSAALDCGFGHLGDFAAAYKARFGESPSVTLRRRR